MTRTNLGLDVGSEVLRAAAVRKRWRGVAVEQCRELPLAAAIPGDFAAAGVDASWRGKVTENLRELLNPMAGGEERISLSLPDHIGRLCFVETEAGFKSKEEGRDFLRWRLKGVIPYDPSDLHLDYQILKKSPSGAGLAMVAMVQRQWIEVWEDLCEAAGYFPVIIDFHSLNCLNYYHSRIDWEENLLLLMVEDGVHSFFYFRDQIPVYHRCHRVSSKIDRIFDEIRLSVIDCEKRFPHLKRSAFYLHAEDLKQGTVLLEGLKNLFSGCHVLLKADWEGAPRGGEAGAGFSPQNLVAAVGAGLRLLRAG